MYDRQGKAMAKRIHEPGHEKMCLMSYANNKGTDDEISLRICAV